MMTVVPAFSEATAARQFLYSDSNSQAVLINSDEISRVVLPFYGKSWHLFYLLLLLSILGPFDVL